MGLEQRGYGASTRCGGVSVGGAVLDGRLAELLPSTPRTELQDRVLGHDWARTPLGPEAAWSDTLRIAVSTCLNSRFPSLLMWGDELAMVYNDGYAPMPGARHPTAPGSSATVVWADIWADLAPMVAEVMAGRATYSEDLPLVMTRHGFVEETYFSFSFSPVVEPGGRVGGLLDTVVETTHRVLTARRLGILQELGSLPRSVHGNARRHRHRGAADGHQPPSAAARPVQSRRQHDRGRRRSTTLSYCR
jgi:hypothetical protein